MAKVIVDLSISLDGFIAGADDGPGNPLGDGPRPPFTWMGAGPERNPIDQWAVPPDTSLPVVEEWSRRRGSDDQRGAARSTSPAVGRTAIPSTCPTWC